MKSLQLPCSVSFLPHSASVLGSIDDRAPAIGDHFELDMEDHGDGYSPWLGGQQDSIQSLAVYICCPACFH